MLTFIPVPKTLAGAPGQPGQTVRKFEVSKTISPVTCVPNSMVPSLEDSDHSLRQVLWDVLVLSGTTRDRGVGSTCKAQQLRRAQLKPSSEGNLLRSDIHPHIQACGGVCGQSHENKRAQQKHHGVWRNFTATHLLICARNAHPSW